MTIQLLYVNTWKAIHMDFVLRTTIAIAGITAIGQKCNKALLSKGRQQGNGQLSKNTEISIH